VLLPVLRVNIEMVKHFPQREGELTREAQEVLDQVEGRLKHSDVVPNELCSAGPQAARG
jgi:hypothetical protein